MRMEDAPTNATTPWDHMNVAALLIKFLVMTRRLVSVSLCVLETNTSLQTMLAY